MQKAIDYRCRKNELTDSFSKLIFYTVRYESVLILLFVVNDVDPGEQEFSFIRSAFDRL
jgi:hypothetical protein